MFLKNFLKFYFWKYIYNFSRLNVTFLYLFILIKIIFLWNTLNLTFSVQSMAFSLMMVYTVYWLLSVFIFLIKKSLYGKFSSIIQRFWKRSLMLFWSIEIFLFCVYLFLICNSPEETFNVLDFSKFNKSYIAYLSETLYKNLYLIYINTGLYIYLLNIKFSKKKFFILFFVWFHVLFYTELTQIMYYNNYLWNYCYVYDCEEKVWSQQYDYLKSRVYYYYIFVFILLKFWHIFFIYYYMIITYWSMSTFSNNSYNWISSLYQNFFYIYLFNFIFLYVYFKKVVKYYGSIEYTDFFLNQNLTRYKIYDCIYLYSNDYYYFL